MAVEPTPPEADLTTIPLEGLLELDVYAASRFVQRLGDAPSAVRVISAAEIRDFGWRTLGEALASLPGLYTSYDRSYAYLGARGFLRPGDYDTRFLLLIDGQRLNDPVYDQAAIGTDFAVDLDLVERIEYVPGPGSSAFGANAFFGVVNVITRSGRDQAGAEARLEGGSHRYGSLAARYGASWDDGELLLAASALHYEGADLFYPEFDDPATNDGIARGLDDDRARRFLVKGRYRDFHFSLVHSVRTKGDPAASFGQLFNDPRSQNRDERTLLDLSYASQPSSTLELDAHLYLGRYDYDGIFVYEPEPGPVNIDGSRSAWAGIFVQAVTTAWDRHKLMFGIEAQRDFERKLFNYDDPPRVDYLDASEHNHRAGVFVEDEFRLRENLLVNAGLRLDRDGVSGTHLNPRLAVIYAPSEGTNLKAIIGSAYRSPNLYETVYTAAFGPAGSGLEAERIRTGELVWSQRFGDHTSLTMSLFEYRLTDLIDEQFDTESGSAYFANRSRVDTRGVEIGVDHAFGNGATLRASYSHARADADGGAALENSPRHLGKLQFSTPLPGTRLRAAIEGRYVAARDGLLGRVDAYQVVDLTLSGPDQGNGFEWSVGLRNAFDERYADPAGPAYLQNAIKQDGRTFFVRAAYRF